LLSVLLPSPTFSNPSWEWQSNEKRELSAPGETGTADPLFRSHLHSFIKDLPERA
jgi:hypothetical protein